VKASAYVQYLVEVVVVVVVGGGGGSSSSSSSSSSGIGNVNGIKESPQKNKKKKTKTS